VREVVNSLPRRRSPPVSRASRTRPGERPLWWDAAADRAEWAAWRTESSRAGLALDIWVSLLLEARLVVDDLHAAGIAKPTQVLRDSVSTGARETRLAPTPELRAWAADLSPDDIDGQAAGRHPDELPELVLPARLASRLAPGACLAPLLNLELFGLARACDRAAALHGRTFESWALATALALERTRSGATR
jgi:hypothetical protein